MRSVWSIIVKLISSLYLLINITSNTTHEFQTHKLRPFIVFFCRCRFACKPSSFSKEDMIVRPREYDNDSLRLVRTKHSLLKREKRQKMSKNSMKHLDFSSRFFFLCVCANNNYRNNSVINTITRWKFYTRMYTDNSRYLYISATALEQRYLLF